MPRTPAADSARRSLRWIPLARRVERYANPTTGTTQGVGVIDWMGGLLKEVRPKNYYYRIKGGIYATMSDPQDTYHFVIMAQLCSELYMIGDAIAKSQLWGRFCVSCCMSAYSSLVVINTWAAESTSPPTRQKSFNNKSSYSSVRTKKKQW